MTDGAWQSIATIVGVVVAGIPSTMVAWAALRQGKNNYAQASEQAKRADGKADKLIEKATEIHTLTNSTLSTTTAALAESTAKNVGLERLVSMLMMGKSADTLAALGIPLPGKEGSTPT